MDEEDEMNFAINAIVVNGLFWFQIGHDVMCSFQCNIPLHFSVLYIVIQFFIIYGIPAHRAWRHEAVVLASFVFCHFCAKGASIFQIDVDADRALEFTRKRNFHLMLYFIILFLRAL
ncbi:hypothetical protein TNCT_425561 [Trichonephila clavata]|uniref:Uncharacterized protein n=1 Tax=Trichonephila clavata TaxID=2740835 RepID=A0A8X6FEK9_TRICU|nr:hypothetical protein TNCT_425561 [Trichonephila clavata]